MCTLRLAAGWGDEVLCDVNPAGMKVITTPHVNGPFWCDRSLICKFAGPSNSRSSDSRAPASREAVNPVPLKMDVTEQVALKVKRQL
jgi:hypothetical protein